MGLKSIIKNSGRFLRKGVLALSVPIVMGMGCAPNSYYLKDDFSGKKELSGNLEKYCREGEVEVKPIRIGARKGVDTEKMDVNQLVDTCGLDSLGILTSAEGLRLEEGLEGRNHGLTKKIYFLRGQIKNWEQGENEFPFKYFGEKSKRDISGLDEEPEKEILTIPQEGEYTIKFKTDKTNPKQIVRAALDYALRWGCCNRELIHGMGARVGVKPLPRTDFFELGVDGNIYIGGKNLLFYDVEGNISLEALRKHLREVDLGIRFLFGYSNHQPLGRIGIGGEVYGDELGNGNLGGFARVFEDLEYSFKINSWIKNGKYYGITYEARIEFLLDITKKIAGLYLGTSGNIPLDDFEINRSWVGFNYPGTSEKTILRSQGEPFGIKLEVGPKFRAEIGDFKIDFKPLYFNYLQEYFKKSRRVEGSSGFIFQIKGGY